MSKMRLQEIKITITGKDRNYSYTIEPEEPITTIDDAIGYLEATRDDVEELKPEI